MSLKRFEQAWLELLLDPSRQHVEHSLGQLSPRERASLQALDSARLEAWASATQAERLQRLEAALPRRLRQLLSQMLDPAACSRLLLECLNRGGLPPLYPRPELLSSLFKLMLDQLGREGQTLPHLRDLLSYELAAAELEFFGLPRAQPAVPGPQLAAWARLIRLGPQFPVLLDSLDRDYALPELPEAPKQRYLLTREFRGLRLEVLQPLMAACLERCDGQRSWATVLAEARQAEPNAMALPEAWLELLLQRGVLIQSPTAESA